LENHLGPPFFFQKNTLCYSFKMHYCHSFHITVIPSGLLSFRPYYCHSFCISVIPSISVSFLPNIVIPSISVSFLPNIVIPSASLPFQIFVILNSSCTLPYPKVKKVGQQSRPFLRVIYNFLTKFGNSGNSV
jgi:hypothetical protein